MDKIYHFPLPIFRAYDIRGKLTALTPKVVAAIGYALVEQYRLAGQKQIVIGYDARLTSPVYAQILKQVFEQHDFCVIDLGCCSSPMMYFMARQYGGNGIIVTASHNPKSDNGIKWIIQGEPPSPQDIDSLGQAAAHGFMCIEQERPTQHSAHQIKPQYCLAYQQELLQDIKLERPFKVVLDGLHGSAGHCAEIILKKLGCDVIALRCQANGEFPDHAPDPSQAAHLNLMRQAVLAHQADLGIALDGDGDRLVLVDEHAEIITADRLICLFAQICLGDKPQAEIVFDVKCSSLVAKTIRHLNGQATMIRTGSSFLRKYLSQSQGKAVFGGEYAGHYVFNDGRGLGYDDGLYAALRVMEYLSLSPDQTLSGVFKVYPKRYYTEDIYIQTHQSLPAQVLTDLTQSSQYIQAKLSTIDGVRLDFEEGFGIIRASNTGEYFTVRFDAENAAQFAYIKQQFVYLLQDKYPKIAHDISNIH